MLEPPESDDVLVQLGMDVDRCRPDRLEEHLRDAWLLDVDQVRLKLTLGRLEAAQSRL